MNDRTTTTTGRRERADAQRNRARLLSAAQAVFASSGPSASLEEIARQASVGIGTLYRHFPTRQSLLEAVFSESVSELCARADALATDEPPYEALRAWLHAQLMHAMTYGSLAASAMLASLDEGARTTSCQAMQRSLETLLERAQQAGDVRSDIEADDLMRFIGAIALAGDDSPDGRARAERLLDIAAAGLRTKS